MPPPELTGLERDVRDLMALAVVDGTPLNGLARAVVARIYRGDLPDDLHCDNCDT